MRFQAGNDTEGSGLSAARRPNDGDQLADVGEVFDGEVDVLKRELGIRAVAKGLGDMLEGHYVRGRQEVLLRRSLEQSLGTFRLGMLRNGSFGGMSGFGHKSFVGLTVRKEQL